MSDPDTFKIRSNQIGSAAVRVELVGYERLRYIQYLRICEFLEESMEGFVLFGLERGDLLRECLTEEVENRQSGSSVVENKAAIEVTQSEKRP